LIEIFRKQRNPRNYGHQGSILGGHFLYVRVSRTMAKSADFNKINLLTQLM
jgi:hypothetical protein